jgi:chemotaxis signal transduction protein
LGAIVNDILDHRNGFAAFLDASGKLLAATDPALACGATIGFEGDAAVVEQGGAHYACARVKAPGYREFKLSDGYRNGACAIVGLRLGTSERRQSSYSDSNLRAAGATQQDGLIEAAVFQVGAARYALPAGAVLKAVPIQALMRTPDFGGMTIGVVDIDAGSKSSSLARVVCARRLFNVEYPARHTDGVILVLRPLQGLAPIALRVDDVLTVIAASPQSVHAAPAGLARFGCWVEAFIDCESTGPEGHRTVLVQLLSSDRMRLDLTGGGRSAAGAEPSPVNRVPH